MNYETLVVKSKQVNTGGAQVRLYPMSHHCQMSGLVVGTEETVLPGPFLTRPGNQGVHRHWGRGVQ